MPTLYNGPEETCLRAAMLMEAAYPRSLSVDDLSPLDHAVVHTADFGGPASLHHANPRRGFETGVRRGLLVPALEMARDIGFVEEVQGVEGTRYVASEEMPSLLDLFEAPYSVGLFERARWLIARLDGASPAGLEELRDLIAARDVAIGGTADWDDLGQLARFEALEAIYASDHGRMWALAEAAYAFSVLRFDRAREHLSETDPATARTMSHVPDPDLLALRDAALAEQGKVARNRAELLVLMDGMRASA